MQCSLQTHFTVVQKDELQPIINQQRRNKVLSILRNLITNWS